MGLTAENPHSVFSNPRSRRKAHPRNEEMPTVAAVHRSFEPPVTACFYSELHARAHATEALPRNSGQNAGPGWLDGAACRKVGFRARAVEFRVRARPPNAAASARIHSVVVCSVHAKSERASKRRVNYNKSLFSFRNTCSAMVSGCREARFFTAKRPAVDHTRSTGAALAGMER